MSAESIDCARRIMERDITADDIRNLTDDQLYAFRELCFHWSQMCMAENVRRVRNPTPDPPYVTESS